MRTHHWPLFDLVVRTPRLELRHPDDEMAVTLADLAARGIHDPDMMPFGIPWTDAPPGVQERNTLQHFWSNRALWTVDEWHLTMAVLVDGLVVGSQGMFAKRFALSLDFEIKTDSVDTNNAASARWESRPRRSISSSACVCECGRPASLKSGCKKPSSRTTSREA